MEKYTEKEFLFANYNQSLALKELGFDMPCFGRYQIGGDFVLSHTERYVISNGTDRTKYFILRPLKSQVFEWFRKQGYDTKVEKESEGLYFGFYWTGAAWIIVGNGSYEEAESACIDKLISIYQKPYSETVEKEINYLKYKFNWKIRIISDYILPWSFVLMFPTIIIYFGYYIKWLGDMFLSGHYYHPRIPYLNSLTGHISFDKNCFLWGIALSVVLLVLSGGDIGNDDDIID